MSGMHLSKEFFELLKAIGESKSKQEEDRIIAREVAVLKRKMETPGGKKTTPYGPGSPGPQNALATNKKKAKEFLVRLLYVEMLGHDGSFGYIKAVEMAASSSIVHKKTGYLVCASCLSPDHEFRFMLVNQMQRDLASSHVLEVCASLIAVTNLITADMAPAVHGEVSKCLDHQAETVRKKAIIALHRLHQISPDVVTQSDLVERLRKVLCDRDPAVMGASLNAIESVASVDPVPFKDLVPSLISILKQVCEKRLPDAFEYHKVPAPWIQMKIVRILALLGKNDAQASNGMYEILSDCMKRADVGVNAGYAIMYECVRTITAIYPNPTLLDAAADAISRLLGSRAQNLRYLGLTGLAGIVEGHPKYAAAHQMAVIECLEDKDETIQRKTLDLLYRMTNPVNVEFVVDKLLLFIRGSQDPYLRKSLTSRICTIAERFAPSNAWYVKTITELFEISGEFVSADVAQNLMSLIAEGSGEGEDGEDSEEADMLLRQHAVEIYAAKLDGPKARLPRVLVETMAWVLGEYAYLSANYTLDDILVKLCDYTKTSSTLDPTTRKFLVSAIMKLVAQMGTCPSHAASVIDTYTKSRDVDLQQRCKEFQNLLTTAPHLLSEVLPVDASCEDVGVDENLSFLDGFVAEAVQNGAKVYDKPEDDDDEYGDDYGGAYGASSSAGAFKMTPYEKPTSPTAANFAMRGVGSVGSGPNAGVALPPSVGAGSDPYSHGGGTPMNQGATSQGSGEPQLVLRNVASVWGKGGLSQPGATAAAAAPPVAPAPAPAAPPAASHVSSASAQGYGFGGQPAVDPSPPSVEKSAAQLEKERMAAMLFGGVVPGAPAPPPSSAPPPPKPPSTGARSAPATAAAPPPAPAAAVEIDLLDMTFDAPAATAPADIGPADVLSPTPVESPPEAPPEVPPESAPAPPPVPVDPFAAEGLLDGLSDTPLASLSSASDSKFEYQGNKMAPMPINTAEFGAKWGSLSSTSPLSATTAKVATLDQFMSLCESIGAHKVEAISATNEGICAGIVGGSIVALFHGKISASAGGAKVDVTIKSSDANMGGVLAMFMQNML
mmetsp:Transcript_36217/g.79277  ORF Transcript_36217/g.79277 Transcript_36217/m.79277 type:complete len:1063 (-) Transcript_36217:1167-4355(-)|eukprot:CAMPEP_0178500622 /NCGR_PEP_ID=MMETSP0696-20121128/16491_1 /TAXON_ID=265572 /ORGANISM="Extubocellulus spinifer, Strain CCMP396" /LENGTH=1062 /DNA_ID=CAMNT_0020129469 /DNA_START=113 /DNA_END=3301 /DNA_ORIENTATION=-